MSQAGIICVPSFKRNSCYNISKLIPSNGIDDDFLVHILPFEDRLKVSLFGRQSKELRYQVLFWQIKHFIADIPKIFDKKVLGVILQVFNFQHKNYPNNVVFCQSLKAKLDVCKVRYYFASDMNIFFAKTITAADISVNYGDSILVIFTDGEWMRELVYTKNGYKLGRKASNENFKKMDDVVLDIVVQHYNPKKVIVSVGKNHQRFMKVLKSKNPILLDIVKPDYDGKCLEEIAKWMWDNTYTRFHVIPDTGRIYAIGYQFNETEYVYILIGEQFNLPAKETITASKLTSMRYFMSYHDEQTDKQIWLKEFSLNESAHEYKITLKIDINNFPTCEVEDIVLPRIVNFPKHCDALSRLHGINLKTYPVIGILANRAFVCICKNGKFEFLKSCGGQWGTPTQIAFNKTKPQFGKAAEETLARYGKFGVQDILQIMAETKETINTITPHGYGFTENDEHPILVEFETFDGTKRAAPPEFLAAMILRENLKAVHAETGEKATSIAFCIFNDFTEKENQNIQKSLETACDLIRIKERCFVSWK